MQTIFKNDAIAYIKKGIPFQGFVKEAGIYIKVTEYVPYVCTAIHAGHKMDKHIESLCLISEKDRFKEEDPYTDKLIDSFPITIVAHYSRYEYDLNRSHSKCIYTEAWGELVWSQPLTLLQMDEIKSKHIAYYELLHELILYLETRFGGSILFDVHSYNWQIRQHLNAPVFNLGTYYINATKWSNIMEVLKDNLLNIELPNIDVSIMSDVVFQGEGYQAEYVNTNFSNTLLLPIEVKKVFMDEHSGSLFPIVFERLQEGIHSAIFKTASYFNDNLKKSNLNFIDLLSSDIEPCVIFIDRELYKIAKNLETLAYVNPVNIRVEKKKFLQQRNYTPNFKYKQLRINPYEFKERLHLLPVSDILDPFVRNLYRSTIESYAIKIDMLTHVGSPHFLYNSLRYYGEPSKQDIKNAQFLLHASYQEENNIDEKKYKPTEVLALFKNAAEKYGLSCKVKLSSNIVAKAMVGNAKKTLYLNKNISLTKFEIDSLVHHELGVHMVTTLNACMQPLQVFKLGLPGNTYTQEGLAIFSEYLSGNLNLERLKQLALRVIVVNMMVEGASFSSAFHYLIDEFSLSTDSAFTLCLRAYRGGGFTKDYLYLSGFRDIAAMHKEHDITPLLIGKTGVAHFETLTSMIDRGWVVKPQNITPSFLIEKKFNNPILDYLISSIKK